MTNRRWFARPVDVVLLAEDVDRNIPQLAASLTAAVVLLAEDVDRNYVDEDVSVGDVRRPPRGGRG